jgi:hypothetical protein
MVKQSVSKTQIERQKPPTSLVKSEAPTEEMRKKIILADYMEKFAIIGNRVVTPQLQAIYFEALRGFELRRIEKGLRQYLQEGTGWPWPGTLAEYIEDQI